MRLARAEKEMVLDALKGMWNRADDIAYYDGDAEKDCQRRQLIKRFEKDLKI
jgi:hypothetical protein